MNLEKFLLEVVKRTDGWVIVVIFAIAVGHHCYKIHADGSALRQSLDILRETMANLLSSISQDIGRLIERIDHFMARAPREE